MSASTQLCEPRRPHDYLPGPCAGPVATLPAPAGRPLGDRAQEARLPPLLPPDLAEPSAGKLETKALFEGAPLSPAAVFCTRTPAGRAAQLGAAAARRWAEPSSRVACKAPPAGSPGLTSKGREKEPTPQRHSGMRSRNAPRPQQAEEVTCGRIYLTPTGKDTGLIPFLVPRSNEDEQTPAEWVRGAVACRVGCGAPFPAGARGQVSPGRKAQGEPGSG